MKFTHMADVHLGGWREPAMSELGMKSFEKVIDNSITENVDFVIIAGDLFNTSLPNIDYIKETVKQLKNLKIAKIPVYIIPGSHDFSPTGKTMLDVLEQADLLINVVKAKKLPEGKIQLQFTIDPKTNVMLTGMLGKKNMLEKSYYEQLDFSNLDVEGFKIFLFHSALDELKPSDMQKMESSPISLLPKNFDYYAGGHVHIVEHKNIEGYKNVIYPGPVFPNSFSELQKLKHGSYYIYDNGKIIPHKIQLKSIENIEVDCNNFTPEQINNELRHTISNKDFSDKIVLLRLSGKLKLGKITDIDLKTIISFIYQKGAYFVMKNTSTVTSSDFQEIKKAYSSDLIEDEIINEHLGQIKIENINLDQERNLIKELIHTLSIEKIEGETTTTFEERILKDINLIK
ncbi:MAG: metallophosphoesterase family protein [Candidatus Woesearchaeota archaeon]